LDIARSDAGAMAVSMELMDLGDIVASAQSTIGPLAVGARVTLATTVAPDVPLVSGDYEKMMRILENLGSNAVKFTPAGGTVSLSAMREEETGDVLVTVSDNGIGIAKENQERIFERFFQVDSSATLYSGSGLGLALVRSTRCGVYDGGKRAGKEARSPWRTAAAVVELDEDE
ncbi:MAG: sensor histidine kinase, partial [Adlercreutzia sp.]